MILICVMLLFGGSPAHAEDHMAPSDSQATFFTGEPFTAVAPSGTKYRMTFTPNGKITREPFELSGTKDTGTWKLSTNGFCTTGRVRNLIVLPLPPLERINGLLKKSRPRLQ
jgi:hypothetical protein